MEDLKLNLIQEAKEKFIEIHPVSDKSSFDECFTFFKSDLIFWFNTKDNGTHILRKNMKN